MKNVYGKEILEAGNIRILNELKKHEKKTKQKVALKQNNKRFRGNFKVIYFFSIYFNILLVIGKKFFKKPGLIFAKKFNLIEKTLIINPLSDFFYIKLAFLSWKSYTNILKESLKSNDSHLPSLFNPEFIEENPHLNTKKSEDPLFSKVGGLNRIMFDVYKEKSVNETLKKKKKYLIE